MRSHSLYHLIAGWTALQITGHVDVWGGIQGPGRLGWRKNSDGHEEFCVVASQTFKLYIHIHIPYIYVSPSPLSCFFLQPFYLLLGLNEQYLCLQFLFLLCFCFFQKRQDNTHTHTEREERSERKENVSNVKISERQRRKERTSGKERNE